MRNERRVTGSTLRVILLGALASSLWAQTVPALRVTPVSLSFSYTQGQSTLPAAQSLAVNGGNSAAPLHFTVSVAAGPWLVVTPIAGTAPLSVKVSANPTTLAVGTYNGTVTLTTIETSPQIAVVPVSVTVKAPPPTLAVAPNPVLFAYIRGTTAPDPVELTLTTSGALLPYSLTYSGGSWLSVSPKSGIVFPGFPATAEVSVSPASLAPGSYKGTITISASQAANKTQAVSVTLIVSAGVPSIDSLWPNDVVSGSPATTVTISGSNFYSGSVVNAGGARLNSTLLGPDAMTAQIPADLLSDVGTVSITVSNPGSGGGDSTPADFTVSAPGPKVLAVVNAASFVGGPVAPGELVVLFGRDLGPATLTVFDPPATGDPIATSLAGTQVLFGTTPAPIIYTSDGQVSAVVPYDVAGKTSVPVVVDNGGTAIQRGGPRRGAIGARHFHRLGHWRRAGGRFQFR